MAAVELTADVPMTPRNMWDHVSDLLHLGDWLVMHEGWRSELPDEITEGTEIVGVARGRTLRLELGGRALFGPAGSAAARAVKGDVEKSLKNFVELHG